MATSHSQLPSQLRLLVKSSGALLGEVIQRELGPVQYRRIEALRQEMASLRGMSADDAYRVLGRSLKKLEKLSREERRGVAHSFSLFLELMNACENAYRTYRLRDRPLPTLRKKPEAVISVLTAHPTEARSPDNIAIFHQIQGVLEQSLLKNDKKISESLRHLLEVAWRISIARNRKPTVEDEAEHLYSIVLRPDTLHAILEANDQLCPIYFRSWVGGDKDGHPGVNERSTQGSLQLSRDRLYCFTSSLLDELRDTLELVKATSLEKPFRQLRKSQRSFRVLRAGDGERLRRFRKLLAQFSQDYAGLVGAEHPALRSLRGLIRVFPALVIPLELREASDEILEAVKVSESRSTKSTSKSIERMLRKVRSLSSGGDPRWYARGLVISMTRDLNDIRAACKLVRKVFGGLELPVIPLFEQAAAMQSSPEIVEGMLGDSQIRRAIDHSWNGYLEVMLGYSDSAKEMGVLPSRLAIESAVKKLDLLCRKKKVKPLFFHGSGGSTDRGGGSIEEQTSWWPESARKLFKVTVQGEMVERMFSTPAISLRQLSAAAQQLEKTKKSQTKSFSAVSREDEALAEFASVVSILYREKIASPDFLEVVQRATPYGMLQKLRIGSRPSKRAAVLSVSSLRAIPWVLCWTQTRVLFPTWWGVGSAWKGCNPARRQALKKACTNNNLFSSYVKALGFTLAKVELAVWRLYLERSGLPRRHVESFYREFEREYRQAVTFVRELSGERDLVWFRPWLGHSIQLRSPMIHPLNLLQILNRDSMQDEDVLLTRETVTGIASGMLTTG